LRSLIAANRAANAPQERAGVKENNFYQREGTMPFLYIGGGGLAKSG